MTNFWLELQKPILCLAPLYHVTDMAFREIIAKYGKPDVMFTEFTPADGLISEGRERLEHLLLYSDIQRPIVAQIFGITPEKFFKTAQLLAEMGFDGIDINFGCPDKNIVKTCAGAGAINDPQLAKELVLAAKEGSKLPVSIKTRTGYNKNIVEEWSEFLLKLEPAALTIHARTKKEMSKVPANWDDVSKVVGVRDRLKSKTLIIGNGDVKTVDEANEKVKLYNCDGVMIGRGIFGNPWLFNKSVKKEDLQLDQVLEVLKEHTHLFEKYFMNIRNFDLMKKHFASYLLGFENTKELKMQLMETKSYAEVDKIINNYLNRLHG